VSSGVGRKYGGGMALKFYGMYSIYFIILIHIISNYLAVFTYMYSCNIWDYVYVNMSRYLIYYACSLYLMCIVQNVLTYIYIFIYVYVYITVRLVFFFSTHWDRFNGDTWYTRMHEVVEMGNNLLTAINQTTEWKYRLGVSNGLERDIFSVSEPLKKRLFYRP
jgi:hypothetical protein